MDKLDETNIYFNGQMNKHEFFVSFNKISQKNPSK